MTGSEVVFPGPLGKRVLGCLCLRLLAAGFFSVQIRNGSVVARKGRFGNCGHAARCVADAEAEGYQIERQGI